MREDLVAFFDRIGVATDELRDYVVHLDKKNTSEHSHESIYYTADLAELVRIRDHALVKRFGFTFEGVLRRTNAMQLLNEADAGYEPTLLTLDQTNGAIADSQKEVLDKGLSIG